jgi:hypothetical protein
MMAHNEHLSRGTEVYFRAPVSIMLLEYLKGIGTCTSA